MVHPSRRPSARPWRPVGRALASGVLLSLLQWVVEQTPLVQSLTRGLAHLLFFAVSSGFGVPARLDGLDIDGGVVRQAVTPNCLGLIAITVYLSALLAVRADWACRWRGVRRDVPLLILTNGIRLCLLVVLAGISVWIVPVAHLVIFVALAPLVIMAIWGLWLTRDLRALPSYPVRFLGLVALLLVPAIGVWWVVLRPYLAVVVFAVRVTLAGLFQMPIADAGLVDDGFKRFLDLTLPGGGLRLELAARSLSLAPYLALVAASPIPFVRRIRLSAIGIGLMCALQSIESIGLILLGASVPALVSLGEAISDYLTLATGPFIWFLLAVPSGAWWAPPGPTAASRSRSPSR